MRDLIGEVCVETDETHEQRLERLALRQATALENIRMTSQWIFWAVVALAVITAVGLFGR